MSEKISNYKLVVSGSDEEFSEKVQKEISAGWEVYGFAFTRPIAMGGAQLCQVVVRYDRSDVTKRPLPTRQVI